MSGEGKDLIDPSGVPHFIGDLSTLETEVMLLSANAAQFRASGGNIHTLFQGLAAFYHAPEASALFATTVPVKAKTDEFAGDLEQVAQALADYGAEVRPLAERLETLRAQASAFVASLAGDDDWHKDQDKVDRNNELWREVNHTVAAFQAAELACHNRITALVGGTVFTVDDGSHSPTMYGYRAEDLDLAGETPWGAPAEREYEGWDWLKHHVSESWNGVWEDGVLATVHGVATLFGHDGWAAAGQAWKSLAQVSTASALTSATAGTWWLVPEDKLPSWLRESRTAYKQTVKGFVAWDTWKTNPSRAAGTVGFNVLTTIGGTEGAGAAASAAGKTSAGARALSVAGKVGRAIDPMTYVGKAGGYAFVKIGDTFRVLKDLHTGAIPHLVDQADAMRSPRVPADAIPDIDTATGKTIYLVKEGDLLNADGTIHQPKEQAPKEASPEPAESHAGARVDGLHELAGVSARSESLGIGPTARQETLGASMGHESGHSGGNDRLSPPHDAVHGENNRFEAGAQELGGVHREHATGFHGGSEAHAAHPDNSPISDTPHGADGSELDHLHVDDNPLPPPGPGEKLLGDLAEGRVQRTEEGLISQVDGRPVTQFLDQLSHERALTYLEAKETGTFPRAQTGACVGSVIDLRTGRVVEAINGPKGPDGEIPLDRLHPTLMARYEQIMDAPPHRAPILAHAEVKATNELLWARKELGLPDGPEALRELRASVQFPFLKDLTTGTRPRPAPFCGNCNHMLDGVPSSYGRYLKDPPVTENWIP
ncbi:hypothetical protein [Streptomyces sp. bgisy154]|uniref:hypothetical protein n=1 Tax=Streptomyces sp. bgisy154 TaxID=3413794 RepID=UPI003D741D2C